MVPSVVILGAVLAVTPQVRILDARGVQALLPAAAVVDARPADAFRQAHVPGAQSMPWEAFTRETPGLGHLVSGSPQHWGQLAQPRDVEPRLRAMGLSNTRTVVVVGDPQGWGDEGRAAWSLLYWGATDVVLLDGGLPAWVGAGFPTEKGGAATPQRGTFTVRPVEQRRAGMQQVWDVVRGQPGALLDVRSAQEFAGSVMPGQTRTLTWVAKYAGVYPFYCTDFCSALHQEMQGYIRVAPSGSAVALSATTSKKSRDAFAATTGAGK